MQRRGRSLGGGKQTKCATLMNVKAFPSRRQQICSWALSAGQMIDPASKSKQKDGRIFFFSRSLRHTATAKTNNQSKNGRIIFFFFFFPDFRQHHGQMDAHKHGKRSSSSQRRMSSYSECNNPATAATLGKGNEMDETR